MNLPPDMEYKHFRRQVRLSEIFGTELDGMVLKLYNFVDRMTSGLELYTAEDAYPNSLFYFKGFRFMYKINTKYNHLAVGENVYNVLYYDFSFTDTQIDNFCINMVNDIFKVNVEQISFLWDQVWDREKFENHFINKK